MLIGSTAAATPQRHIDATAQRRLPGLRSNWKLNRLLFEAFQIKRPVAPAYCKFFSGQHSSPLGLLESELGRNFYASRSGTFGSNHHRGSSPASIRCYSTSASLLPYFS
jgi:hypothetical protein